VWFQGLWTAKNSLRANDTSMVGKIIMVLGKYEGAYTIRKVDPGTT
jgi:hypothetical protein